MNKIILMGRLTKDPEVRYTQNGKVVCQFTLAVDRPFASEDGKREADFINCQIWGKPAELVGNGVVKGQRLLVDGRLQIRTYDAQDGGKRWVTEVVCNNFEYIEKKGDNVGGAAVPDSVPETAKESVMEGFGSAVPFDQDIPF